MRISIAIKFGTYFVFRVTYTKKKEKQAQITAIKDETIPRNDVYKSHQIHVPSGEPPNSISRPAAKRKPGVVRPITSGKLLRKGGPSDVRVQICKCCIRIDACIL